MLLYIINIHGQHIPLLRPDAQNAQPGDAQ